MKQTPGLTDEEIDQLSDKLRLSIRQFEKLSDTFFGLVNASFLPLYFSFIAQRLFALSNKIADLTRSVISMKPWSSILDRPAVVDFLNLHLRAERTSEEILYQYEEMRRYDQSMNYQEKKCMDLLGALLHGESDGSKTP